jgi:hypothetical protein
MSNQENLKPVERPVRQDIPQYVVYCSYKIKGRYVERVVSGVLTWYDATALRFKLQQREIKKNGATWSSWTGRIYSRRRVPNGELSNELDK